MATPADARPPERVLLAALLAVQVLFGGLAVAGKLVFLHMPPLAVALLRLVAGALILTALERALVRSGLAPWRDLARFALFALLGTVLNIGLFLEGLRHTTATNAVLLVATIPAFTLLVAVLLRHERAGAWQVAGLSLAFLGILVLVVGAGLDFGAASLLGSLFIVANALCYSVYLVLSRPVLARYDSLTVIMWVFLFGALEMALVAVPSMADVDWRSMDAVSWGSLAYILVGATVLTYGLNAFALRYTSASRVASFVYLQPVVGALLAFFVLDEPLTWKVALAGALILAGVAIANRVAPSRRAGTGG